MKSLVSCLAVVSAVLVASAAGAQPLVLYDDFSGPLLDPAKWRAGEGGNHVMDAIRRISNHRLQLAAVTYGDQSSDTGVTNQGHWLTFVDPASVTAIQTTVTVLGGGATACATNPGGWSGAQFTLQGTFFNAGVPTPGDTTNDVYGAIYIARFAPDPPNTFSTFYNVWQCLDRFCGAATTLAAGDLGTVSAFQSVMLLVQWDQPNHRFIFQRGANPPAFAPYSVSDGASPGNPVKYVEISNGVPNCTSTPRPGSLMSVLVGSVFVNP